MEKLPYSSASIEVVLLNVLDVISTSIFGDDMDNDGWTTP